MRRLTRRICCLCTLLLAACGAPSMVERLETARHTLAEVNTLKDHPTVKDMQDAKGVALLSIVQGGAGLGGEGGGGIVLRREGGGWGSPYAVDVGAGTIGLQLGGQGKDVLILFNDEATLKEFVAGGMNLQALGEGTFGAASGNTKAPKPATSIFTKGQGVYGGLELGGLNVAPANAVNAGSYGKADTETILSGKVKPANAEAPLASLMKMLDAMH